MSVKQTTAATEGRPSSKRSKDAEQPLPPTVIEAEGLKLRRWANAACGITLQQLRREIDFLPEEQTRVQVFGRWHNVPRRVGAYGDPGLSYTYAGSTLTPTPWTPLLAQLRDAAQARTGCSFNFVLVNLYRDGNDSMGKHRDNEPELDPETPVVSLSLGATRDFVLHCLQPKGKPPLSLPLRHGDLLAMDPPTNDRWTHSVPVRKGVKAPRLNLTFRRLVPERAAAVAARAARRRAAKEKAALAEG